MAETILVVDDEPKIVSMIRAYLEASGFKVLEAFDGNQALAVSRRSAPDCLVLDISMPGLDGLSVARELRKISAVPIIFLSARAEEIDRILGLELGGDDYLAKPFSPRELLARIRAVLRRAGRGGGEEAGKEEPLVRGALVLDVSRRSLTIRGRPIALTAVQFSLLALMMRRPGKVWTRLELLEGAMGQTYEGYERTVDAHVKNIRKALGDDSEAPRYIETLRGAGYRFMDQPDEA